MGSVTYYVTGLLYLTETLQSVHHPTLQFKINCLDKNES